MMDEAERSNERTRFERELEQLYPKVYPVLVQTAFRVVKNREHAENVVHDVIERLIRNSMKHGPPKDFDKNPRGYLYRAVVNEGISFLRSRSDIVDEGLNDPDLILTGADWEGDVNWKLALREALSKLDPELAAILSLHYWDGYDYGEIAKMTGRTGAGVAMAMVRARRKLKKLLLETVEWKRRRLKKLESNPGEVQ